MKTQTPPLRASPLQIEHHEFLDIEVHAADAGDAGGALSLSVNRSFAPHNSDPLRWRVELTVRFGGEQEGKPPIYSGMIRIAGYFCVHEKYPEAKRQQLLEVTAASILYGACREMLTNLTARGPHGMASLPSVSFVPITEPETATARQMEDKPATRLRKPVAKKSRAAK